MQSVDGETDHKAPWHCKPESIVPAPSRTGDPNCVPDGGGAFRAAEKRYAGKSDGTTKGMKRKRNGHSNPDLSNVIDFSNLEANTEANRALIEEVVLDPQDSSKSAFFGREIKLYKLKSIEGLFFLPNPFTPEQQRYWVRRCVKDFCIGNPTNLSNLEAIEKGSSTLWTDWKQEDMPRLRWSSLGYHYQWTPRVYTEEHRGIFPDDLFSFVRDSASLLGHKDMRAEAAIINYYPHSKCMMGGHLDDAEEAMEKPIVSASFGNTVIFLIGGRTRDVEPSAMYIRSGDIVFMAGHARYCFHGVPKMMPGTSPEYLHSPTLLDQDPNWSAELSEYMKDARVNMNVRQVRINETTSPTASSSNS
jgi:alkylated DNA repair protein alkB family protein 1